jgi:hypothetical protein
MSVHIEIWEGGPSARITEMVNAHKRGLDCRVLRVSCVRWHCDPLKLKPEQQLAARYSTEMMAHISEIQRLSSHVAFAFDDIREGLISLVNLARSKGAGDSYLSVTDETIKAIRAPRVALTAGVEGKWSASADESGISMLDLVDVNQWREITHRQTAARAYEIAAKVWPRVQAAPTLRAAAEVLRQAGARLHGYCGMD